MRLDARMCGDLMYRHILMLRDAMVSPGDSGIIAPVLWLLSGAALSVSLGGFSGFAAGRGIAHVCIRPVRVLGVQ